MKSGNNGIQVGSAASEVRATVVRTLVAVAATVAVLALAFALVLVFRPSFAQPLLDRIEALDGGPGPGAAASQGASDQADGANGGNDFSQVGDTTPTDEQLAAEEEQRKAQQRTPLIARCGKVKLYSSIAPADLTGVLFHQASYPEAIQLTTKLAEADYEKAASKRQIRVNTRQDSGTWLDADALHLWRTQDTTPMDTSIDEGARPGTTVRAPVTGTVVLVRDYKLYDEVPDIQIHIQPEGHPELDCVMLHTTDPAVKAGDAVEGGVTEICKVRDIEKDLTDVQLGFFTPEGVGGNHVHVQVNDADYPNYRKEKLKGAYKVKES